MSAPETEAPLLVTEEEPLEPSTPPPPKPSVLELHRSLQRLEWFLRYFGFCQYSPVSITLSWLSFLVLGVAAPVLIVLLYYCYSSNCEEYQIKSFEVEVVICQVLASAISLICISRSLGRYGVRKFIFVDQLHGEGSEFHDLYVKEINKFFRLVAMWVLPCFLLKTARETVRVVYLHHGSQWQVVTTLIAVLVSWFYSIMIYLAGTALFHLVCSLQVIHFDHFAKLVVERDLEISYYLHEHMALTYHLSKISHRFRIFLILEFVLVTASQCMVLIETTTTSVSINIINSADFVVSSIVQVVGITICLHAASKITHRAQALASVAGKWHALLTNRTSHCSTPSTVAGNSVNTGNVDSVDRGVHIAIDQYSESDMDYTDGMSVNYNMQLVSHMTTYHKRQAFVLYLLTNPGGVTLFGWTIDRGFLITIFLIQLSLVTCILGNTLSLSTSS